MSTINAYGDWLARGVHEDTWTPVTSGDAGSWLDAYQFPDKHVQVLGTWNGATLVMQGTNDDGTTVFTLSDYDGSDISLTADGAKSIRDNPEKIRPNCTVGGASTSLTIKLLSRVNP